MIPIHILPGERRGSVGMQLIHRPVGFAESVTTPILTFPHRAEGAGFLPLDGLNTRQFVLAPDCLSEPEHSGGEESEILRSLRSSE